MGEIPSPRARELVRAEAEKIVRTEYGREEVWQRNYRQMARGTLAALDWVEGRRATTPSSGQLRRPDEVIEDSSSSRRPTALILEIGQTEDWGSGHVRPSNEDMHYHGAVWSLLRWWRNPTDTTNRLAISVPELPEV